MKREYDSPSSWMLVLRGFQLMTASLVTSGGLYPEEGTEGYENENEGEW